MNDDPGTAGSIGDCGGRGPCTGPHGRCLWRGAAGVGQTIDVELPAGGKARVFGLEVNLEQCRYPENNPTGDAFAYIVVDEKGKRVFEGWMMASSPALSALDHARYDVWVMRCTTS